MPELEKTCGQELVESAAIPEQVAELFQHVAVNLRAHAAWVGASTTPAQLEHDAMLAVARGYEAIAAQARQTAELMSTLTELPPAPHDRQKWDMEAFVPWMKRKMQIQRELAQMLLEHAEQSEHALRELADEIR